MAAATGAGGPGGVPTGPAGADVDGDSETVAERRRQIKEAFDLFDADRNGTVAEEEVPNIVRYLGVHASDKDMQETIIPAMQEEEPTQYIQFEKFETAMLHFMDAAEFLPVDEETLLQAFRALDPDNTGEIDPEKIGSLLKAEGESPFREREVESFLSFAVDAEKGGILYEDYVAKVVGQAARR